MNQRQPSATDTRIVPLAPGMYIVRFNGVPGPGDSNILSVAPGDPRTQVDFFASEGVQNNTLRAEGDIIVVRCSGGEGSLIVTALAGSSGKTAGTRIDKIAGAAERPAVPGAAPAAQPRQEFLKVSGHVEMEGDVSIQPGQWLGDPNGNRRLEGFAIDWEDRPEDADLAYSCVMGGLGRSPAVLSGGFCGSRRRATPITALTLSLVGKNAGGYRLEMEAVFAGCPPQKVASGVECRGMTGREHLTALRVAILKA